MCTACICSNSSLVFRFLGDDDSMVTSATVTRLIHYKLFCCLCCFPKQTLTCTSVAAQHLQSFVFFYPVVLLLYALHHFFLTWIFFAKEKKKSGWITPNDEIQFIAPGGSVLWDYSTGISPQERLRCRVRFTAWDETNSMLRLSQSSLLFNSISLFYVERAN